MAKIEDKLAWYGYKPIIYDYQSELEYYEKPHYLYFGLQIVIKYGEVVGAFVKIKDTQVSKQSRIDSLQEAFNQLEKDLKELEVE